MFVQFPEKRVFRGSWSRFYRFDALVLCATNSVSALKGTQSTDANLLCLILCWSTSSTNWHCTLCVCIYLFSPLCDLHSYQYVHKWHSGSAASSAYLMPSSTLVDNREEKIRCVFLSETVMWPVAEKVQLLKEREQQKLLESAKLEPIVEENGESKNGDSIEKSSSGQALLVNEGEPAVAPKRHVTIVDYYASSAGDLSTTAGMSADFLLIDASFSLCCIGFCTSFVIGSVRQIVVCIFFCLKKLITLKLWHLFSWSHSVDQ